MEASKTTQNNIFALVVIFLSLQCALGYSAFGARTSSSAKKNRATDLPKPIYFDVLGGPDMETPFVEYEMQDNGAKLKLGSVVIDEKTFSFGLRRFNEIDTAWAVPNETYFFVKWPQFLFPEGLIELLNRDGNVIWKKEIRKVDFLKWKLKVQKSLKNPKSTLHQVNWALEESKAELPLQGLADGFRFCISRLQEKAHDRLCSQRYVVRQPGTQLLLGRLKEIGTPRILVNAESAPFSGQIKSQGELPVRFFSELSTGETLEFTSKPLTVAWSDFVKADSQELYSVLGYETPPAGPYKIINPEHYPKWVQNLGFQSTIYDRRKFWSVQVNGQQPWIYFPGESGGIFKHPLPIQKAPSAKVRLHLDAKTPKGTYRDGVKIKGRKLASTALDSKEYYVKSEPGLQEFTWSIKASENAKINRSYLLLTENGQTYRSYFEIYKGYSNELSTRLSMILSTSGLILMGDAAYNLWFEDILGWDNYYLSKQRWGISTKYFQSITKYNVKGYGKAELRVMNADLKYRLTPGIWTRDESHGVMVSYQDFNAKLKITEFKVPMLGVGWFWARSMPKVVDDAFNTIPMLNYPKWVDMEFIYFPVSADSSKNLVFNFALNFHGQVLWKDNFFGEAGFGIKRYDFIDKTNSFQSDLGYQLNTLYGTVGMGVKF